MNKNIKKDIRRMKNKRDMQTSRTKRKIKDIKEEYSGITILNAQNDNIGNQTWIISIFDFFLGNPVSYLIKNVTDQWIAARIAANHLGDKLRKDKQDNNCYFIDDMAVNQEYSNFFTDLSLQQIEQNEFLADYGRILKTEQIWTEEIK